MASNAFNETIPVFVGLNFVRDIATLDEANAFLTEWPANRRGAAHLTASKACTSALAGQASSEIARRAFAAFARRSGVLAPDLDDMIAAGAAQATKEWFAQ